MQVEGYQPRPFGCGVGSQFHHGHVSRGPPIMPDSRISRVRFEALAILLWAFPGGRGLSAGSHTPRLPWFAHSLVPLQRRLYASTVSGRHAARWNRQVPRVPLPNAAISHIGEAHTLPPGRTLLLGRRSYELIRQSRLALLSFGLSLVQEVFAGCYQHLLPPGSSRRYFCESFLGCLVPCHGGPTKCTYLFLPPCHRPSPTEVWVGFPA